MTHQEIIELATKVYGENEWHESALFHLEAFAKLVAEKERERISQKIAQLPFGDTAQSFSIWVKNDT